MKKIKKILFTLILSFAFIFNLNALTTVKEDGKYNEDTYIVGITRFDGNTVVNEKRALKAKKDFNNFVNSLDTTEILNLETYYYSSLTNKWYLLNKDSFKTLDEENINNLLKDLNIFYVNDEEKLLEITFDKEVDDNSISNERVKFENNKFIVPATVLSFSFKSNNNSLFIDTKENEGNKDYGNLMILVSVNILNEKGNTIETIVTPYNSLLDKDYLFKTYQKEGYKVVFFDENGEVDFDKKINSLNYTIERRYTPVGSFLESENVKFNKETLTVTYNGIIKKDVDTNKNYIELSLVSPTDFDVVGTLVNDEEKSWVDGKTTIKLEINDKTDKIIKVKWNEKYTITYTVKFGENAKFEYLVKYYQTASKLLDKELVLEGEKTRKDKTIIVKPKKGTVFENEWRKTPYATTHVDLNEGITSDLILYPYYRDIPTIVYNNEYSEGVENGFFEGNEGKQTINIKYPKFVGKKIKIIAEFKDQSDIYNENNYIKVFYNNEWVDFNAGIALDLNGNKVTPLEMRIKMDDNSSKLIKFTIYYNGKMLKETYLSTGKIKSEDVTLSVNGNYYKTSNLLTLLRNSSEENPVKLEKDIKLSALLIRPNIKNYNAYLDLNGKTISTKITKNETALFRIDNSYTDVNLTIYNGNITLDKGDNIKDAYTFIVGGKGKYNTYLKLKGVEITSKDNGINGIFVYGNNTSLVLDNSIIKTKEYSVFGNGRDTINSNISVLNSTLESESMTIFNPQTGVLNIQGSTLKGLTPIGIKTGELTLKDSTLNAIKDTFEAPTMNNSGISVTGDAIFAEVNKNYGVVENKSTLKINILENNKFNLSDNVNASILRIYNPEKIEGTTISGELTGKVLDENTLIYN